MSKKSKNPIQFKSFHSKQWLREGVPTRLSAACVSKSNCEPEYALWIEHYIGVPGGDPVKIDGMHLGILELCDNRLPIGDEVKAQPKNAIEDFFEIVDRIFTHTHWDTNLIQAIKMASIAYSKYPLLSGDLRFDIEIDVSVQEALDEVADKHAKLYSSEEHSGLEYKEFPLAQIRYIAHVEVPDAYNPDYVFLKLIFDDAQESLHYSVSIMRDHGHNGAEELISYSEGTWSDISFSHLELLKRVFPFFLCMEEIRKDYGGLLGNYGSDYDVMTEAKMLLQAFINTHDFVLGENEPFDVNCLNILLTIYPSETETGIYLNGPL